MHACDWDTYPTRLSSTPPPIHVTSQPPDQLTHRSQCCLSEQEKHLPSTFHAITLHLNPQMSNTMSTCSLFECIRECVKIQFNLAGTCLLFMLKCFWILALCFTSKLLKKLHWKCFFSQFLSISFCTSKQHCLVLSSIYPKSNQMDLLKASHHRFSLNTTA